MIDYSTNPPFGENFYKLLEKTSIGGAVLNVGYGWGKSADLFAQKPVVASVDTVDLVDNVRTKTKTFSKHKFILGDAGKLKLPKKYDHVYIDIIEGVDDFANVQSVVENCKKYLNPTGRIAVEYYVDDENERSIREYLAANLKSEPIFINGGLGNSRTLMTYYLG